MARFESQSGALPDGASVDDFVTIAGPFASTLSQVDAELGRERWPAVARHDIDAELAADRSLVADLVGTTDVTLILALWRHQIVAAADRANHIRAAVNIDLGLVPPPTG